MVFSLPVSDAEYIEKIKNCSKWNSRMLSGRKRSETAVFDQQTGVVLRPTDHLYRSYTDRRPSSNPAQVCCYPRNQWTKSKGISSDACEMQYFLKVNSALSKAMEDPTSTINQISEFSSDLGTPSRGYYAKYEASEVDISEYDLDQPDNDQSDEDDWGASKKKRKKNNNQLGGSSKPRRNAGSSVNTMGNSGSNNSTPNVEPRFICEVCGAKYKSRPGLNYHRNHVHQDVYGNHGNNSSSNNSSSNNHANQASNAAAAASAAPAQNNSSIPFGEMLTPRSPTVEQPPQPSDYCDFCLKGSECNPDGKPEDLVSCRDCGRAGHPTCLKFTTNMKISTKRHGWQCIECKSCAVCGTSENDDQLLFCDDCDRGFHLYCVTPPLKTPPETDWSCDKCQHDFGDRSSIAVARIAGSNVKKQ